MNPLFQDWSREIDFLAAPPLDHDVFSPPTQWSGVPAWVAALVENDLVPGRLEYSLPWWLVGVLKKREDFRCTLRSLPSSFWRYVDDNVRNNWRLRSKDPSAYRACQFRMDRIFRFLLRLVDQDEVDFLFVTNWLAEVFQIMGVAGETAVLKADTDSSYWDNEGHICGYSTFERFLCEGLREGASDDLECVRRRLTNRGDYDLAAFWFGRPWIQENVFYDLDREVQNLIVETFPWAFENPGEPEADIHRLHRVVRAVVDSGTLDEWVSSIIAYSDYEDAVKILFSDEVPEKGWEAAAKEACIKACMEDMGVTHVVAVVPASSRGEMKYLFARWAEVVASCEALGIEPVDGEILEPEEVVHTRWLAAYNVPPLPDGRPSKEGLADWFAKMVRFELDEAVLPRSWGIERTNRSKIGIGRTVFSVLEEGEEIIGVAFVGLAVDPLYSRPIGLWEGDGWTAVQMDVRDGYVELALSSSQGELRKILHPYYWGDEFPHNYYEVVGWPHFVGVVAGRPRLEEDEVDLSEELARMVARKTGLPYLGRR